MRGLRRDVVSEHVAVKKTRPRRGGGHRDSSASAASARGTARRGLGLLERGSKSAGCIAVMLVISVLQLLSFAGLLQFGAGCDHLDDVRRAEDMMLAQLKVSTLGVEIDAVRANLSSMSAELLGLSAAPRLAIRREHARAARCGASKETGLVEPTAGRLSSRGELLSKTGSSILKALKSSSVETGMAIQRREWDAVFILRLLFSMQLLRPGASALAWSADRRDSGPIVAFLAHQGIKVTMTTPHNASLAARAPSRAEKRGWGGHNARGIATALEWQRMVANRSENLHFISPDLFERYDFTFALHSLESLASVRLGQRFLLNSLDVLRPGGVAIFTAEIDIAASSTDFGREAKPPPAAYGVPSPRNETAFAVWTRSDVRGALDDLQQLGFTTSEMCWWSTNASSKLLTPIHIPRVLGTAAAANKVVTVLKGESVLATVGFWVQKPKIFPAGSRARNFSKLALKLETAKSLVKSWNA